MAAIIFPLREKLFSSPVFLRQRPRSNAWRRVITVPVLPWEDFDRPPWIGFGRVDLPPILAANVWPGFGLCAIGKVATPISRFLQPPYLTSFSEQRFEPTVVHSLRPPPVRRYPIFGVSRDSTGAPLGVCSVDLFDTVTDVKIDTTTSDASGNFTFRSGVIGKTYYIVAYKAGSPDVAGTTVNTLTASSN